MRYFGAIFFFNWIFVTSHIDGATRFYVPAKIAPFSASPRGAILWAFWFWVAPSILGASVSGTDWSSFVCVRKFVIANFPASGCLRWIYVLSDSEDQWAKDSVDLQLLILIAGSPRLATVDWWFVHITPKNNKIVKIIQIFDQNKTR